MFKFKSSLIILTGLAFTATVFAKPEIKLDNHKPCNLFAVDEAVVLNANFAGFPAGDYEAVANVANYFGEKKEFKFPVKVEEGKPAAIPLDMGKMVPSYYELKVSAQIKGADGKTSDVTSEMMSVGVVHFMNRTSEQAMKEGSRFGIKLFQIGKPGVWWRKGSIYDVAEFLDAQCKLGLQWNRHVFNQEPSEEPGKMGTVEMINKFPMNVVLKVEGFPESCFDAQKYGPLEDWVKAKKDWRRNTVPLKEAYIKWLKEEIAKIPESQNVFEIWNEPWDKMKPEDFAEICKMVVQALKESRPNAIVGPNSAMGPFEWELKVIKAGGYEGMTMMASHPYSFTPLPEHRVRGWLRNYHDFIKERLGKDLPIYVTEYGWSTAPQNEKYGKTERQQAQLTVRESLMLYAEDCKALIPHWLADREQDPKEREHWFGIFRLNRQPKPVLVAHAVSARMIDSSKFIGDLWLGLGVGAMLFEKGGKYTLAVWTLDEALGTGKNIQIDVGADEVTLVDLMGAEKKVKPAAGKITVKANGDMTYIVGVSPALAKLAVGPEKELINPWNERSGSFPLHQVKAVPQVDGKLDDWADLKVTELRSDKISAEDASAEIFMGWDDKNIYLAVKVKDDTVANGFDPAVKGKNITDGDSLSLKLGSRPLRQPSIGDYGTLYDYEISIAPVSGSLKPTFRMKNINWDDPIVDPTEGDKSGIRWTAVPIDGGWFAEAAIPVGLFKGLKAATGSDMSFYARIYDNDGTGSKTEYVAMKSPEKPMEWPLLKFEK
ncbi:MAG TPA: hypothetical protein DCZ94_15615 [Lentisphaeria bacterium]|nr:MAG: hypothetical protein A2X48_17000 [Lentisphaerae bacterium GWF2_49_21]HBC88376.1 hypothetical protein [Lentisphaeria bacterium]